MTVNHPQWGTMCEICFAQLTAETCVVDANGTKWDICPGPCALQAGITEKERPKVINYKIDTNDEVIEFQAGFKEERGDWIVFYRGSNDEAFMIKKHVVNWIQMVPVADENAAADD